MTRVVVAKTAWDTIRRELDRVAPREGVVLPLIALEHHREPCAPIALADITTIALAEAHALPPELQRNTAMHVEALPRSDAWADAIVDPLVRQFPRLRAAAYLHSHPFALAYTEPSGGDIDGHMIPLLERNTRTGLAASFSFIACGRWHLPCFAMDARRRVIALGNATVVDDTHPVITRARAPRAPRFWLKRWKQALRARGLAPQIDELFDGWSRARVPLDTHRVLVVLFPLGGPDARYYVVDRRTGRTERVDRKFSLEATEVAA